MGTDGEATQAIQQLDDAATLLASRGAKVVVLPTPFFSRPELGRHLLRFAFCKKMATLVAAVKRLEKLCG